MVTRVRPIDVRKISWGQIYNDFEQHYPQTADHISYWYPYEHLTIILFADDGGKFTYDYISKKANKLRSNV